MLSDLVKIARARATDIQQTHWEGCERDHRECLIQRMADEIERLTAENAALSGEVQRRRQYVEGYDERYTKLEAEIDRLRAALVAAMEIVQEDRAAFAMANIWPDGRMDNDDGDVLRRYDAVIAQADAAMGREG